MRRRQQHPILYISLRAWLVQLLPRPPRLLGGCKEGLIPAAMRRFVEHSQSHERRHIDAALATMRHTVSHHLLRAVQLVCYDRDLLGSRSTQEGV